MSRTRRTLIFALALLFSLLVSACGGGGGGGDETNATGSQWDQMSWDQGKWG